MDLWWEEGDADTGEAGGRFCVTREKKRVKLFFLASGALFFFHFLTNLSAPLLSDGFTGEGLGGRGQEKHALAEKPLPLI